MAAIYSDEEIVSLIGQPKPLPPDWRDRLRPSSKRGHDERRMDLTGSGGDRFRLVLRRSRINPLDFSVILAVHAPGSERLFRLRRYDGRSHQHTNQIEGDSFHDFPSTQRLRATKRAARRWMGLRNRRTATPAPTRRCAA